MTVTRSTPRAPDLTGTALDGRYELHAVIGEGTFGRVYRGRDRRLARPVAVKVIKPWWSEDPAWISAFEREAQLLAAVSDPGIIQIHDVGSAPEGLYYVAELVEGESLASRLRRGRVDVREAVAITTRLARALAAAHARGVVHRDVKPANVMLAAGGQVKIGDFGVARLADGTNDDAWATVAGTPSYMAPEQARGGEATPATDVYAVGVILYEMLAGRPPFRGRTAVDLALQHATAPPPPLPDEVPAGVAGVVMRALAKDPAARPSDGAALAAALGQLTATARAPGRGRRSGAGRQGARPLPRTLVGSSFSERRTVNPPERRQRIALFTAVVLIAAGMVAAAVALSGRVLRVPALRGMTRAQVIVRARQDGFRATFSDRYSTTARGEVVAQTPGAGTRVSGGSSVGVVLSRGPAPVALPPLAGTRAVAAQALLGRLGLRVAVRPVPAPGTSPGTVVAQAPAGGTPVARGSLITLSAAEVPQWRAVATLTGQGPTAVRIRGGQWRLAYSMSYDGTCSFIVFCQAPTATVTDARSGATVDSFDLSDGSAQTHTFTTGPGVYELRIAPGGDSSSWSIAVQDWY